MPGNEDSIEVTKDQGVELNNAEYKYYVQTLYYSQAHSLRIVQALNDDTLPAFAGPVEKTLTRFHRRLNIKRKTANVKRKTYL